VSGAGPLVSVVMPAYDAERFLAEAVESVLAQRYREWELLVVDDGSRDGTRALADRYAAAHPGRGRVLAHPGGENRGISASRNLGLREARGELLAYLDADDVWLPAMLAEHVPLLLAHPAADLVFGNARYWNGWTGRAEDAARDREPPMGVPSHTLVPGPALLAHFLRGGAVPCTCSLLVRRAAVLRVGGQPERFRTMHEDQALYAGLLLAGSAYLVDDCLALYRQHARSTTASAKQARAVRAAEGAYLGWLAAYAAERGVRDAALQSALAGARRRHRYAALVRAAGRAGRLAARLRGRLGALTPSPPAP
jgi:glycosyltransferase involved in cell wall biosynthesis